MAQRMPMDLPGSLGVPLETVLSLNEPIAKLDPPGWSLLLLEGLVVTNLSRSR
jgi:hypothetical protein